MDRIIEIVGEIPTYIGQKCPYEIGLTSGELAATSQDYSAFEIIREIMLYANQMRLDNEKLKQDHAKAMELLAVVSNPAQKGCKTCKYGSQTLEQLNCKYIYQCISSNQNNWRWEYADEYEKLKGGAEK